MKAAHGSSLRVQGGHDAVLGRRGPVGFIPARAGRTLELLTRP